MMRVSSFQTNSNFSTLHTARFSFMASTSQNRTTSGDYSGFYRAAQARFPFFIFNQRGVLPCFFRQILYNIFFRKINRRKDGYP